MAQARSHVALLLALLLLTPCCFVGTHEILASAAGQGGIVGEFIGGLKREDDEAEVREIRERAPQTSEERQEAREAAEQASASTATASEGEDAEP